MDAEVLNRILPPCDWGMPLLLDNELQRCRSVARQTWNRMWEGPRALSKSHFGSSEGVAAYAPPFENSDFRLNVRCRTLCRTAYGNTVRAHGENPRKNLSSREYSFTPAGRCCFS